MEIDLLSIVLLLLIVLFTYLSVLQAPNPDVHPLLLASQSDVARVRLPGETAVYRNSSAGTSLAATPDRDVQTVPQLFKNGRSMGAGCLGTRAKHGLYIWQTYVHVGERVTNFGSGLIKLTGLTPKSGMFGIFMKNRPEWVIADLAASHYSLVSVALSSIRPSLNDIKNAINLTKISTIVASADTLPALLSAAPSCQTLKYVVLAEDEVPNEFHSKLGPLGLIVKTFSEVESMGATDRKEHVLPEPQDTATIVFTSGTVGGGPKAVELTHANLVASVAGLIAAIPNSQKLISMDVHVSYLPLSHMFERIVVTALLFAGAKVAFYSGELEKVFDDARVAKPTIFVSVPRLLMQLQEEITTTHGNKFLFKKAYAAKEASLRKGKLLADSVWDRLVLNQIKEQLGGKVRIIVCSSAPINHPTLEFLRIAFSCQVIQAYGLTQCAGGVTASSFCDYQAVDESQYESHCGPPLSCNEIKLINYEEKGYTVEELPNPRGEVCVRGPNVMKGYYGQPEETAQVIDDDGWLRTGDIGMMLPNGTLMIVDRKLPIKRHKTVEV